MANFKLLSFIPLDLVDNFFNLIKSKYGTIFRNFLTYFKKNYIKGRIFYKNVWNYNNFVSNNLNNDIIFFTNNIVESFNSVLNKKFVGFCRTMFNYKNNLIDVLSLYNMKDKYKEKNSV